jgi:hypothetical protein
MVEMGNRPSDVDEHPTINGHREKESIGQAVELNRTIEQMALRLMA